VATLVVGATNVAPQVDRLLGDEGALVAPQLLRAGQPTVWLVAPAANSEAERAAARHLSLYTSCTKVRVRF